MNKNVERLYNGIIKENPTFVLMLGIPLIVVNCIILGRAESYASKNPVIPSMFDGIGMGLGFTFGLTSIGLIRELLGAGQIFGFQVLSLKWFTPITIFVMAPGAFLVLSCLVAIMNIVRAKMEAKGKPLAEPAGCLSGDCSGCSQAAHCSGKATVKTDVAGKEE